MITTIQFNDLERFNHTDDNNLMDVITENCIILCEDVDIKRFIANEIIKICTGEYSNNDIVGYNVDHDNEPKLTRNITYFPTSLLCIDDNQRIICTIEASSILVAKSVEDIWFAIRDSMNKVNVYPLCVFKGHKDDWEQGIDCIYKNVVNGRYSPYYYNKDFNTDDAFYHMD
jgi:hypothetical protein